MKHWVWILAVVLSLAACSSNRQKEVDKPKPTAYDSMDTTLQQYLKADSLHMEQLQRDIILHRQTLMKTNVDIDALNQKIEDMVIKPQIRINVADIDSLKSNIKSLEVKISEQSELLKSTSENITTSLDNMLSRSQETMNPEKEIDSLKSYIGSPEKSMDSVKGNSAYQTIASLESVLAATQTNVKDLQNQIEQISKEIQTLIADPNVQPNPHINAISYQNQLNEFHTQLSDLKDYIIRLKTQVSGSLSLRDRTTAEQPLVKMEKPRPVEEPKTMEKTEQAAEPKPVAEVESKSETETQTPTPASATENNDTEARALYDQARDVYENSNLDKAIELFKEFLQKYPTHELASNAQYWLGETYYAAAEYHKAIDELQKVLDNYQSAPKAPDAQYKIGMSYVRLGEKARAKTELEKIHSLYPAYERMNLVDKQLGKMK